MLLRFGVCRAEIPYLLLMVAEGGYLSKIIFLV
jgi:hypothetical protein